MSTDKPTTHVQRMLPRHFGLLRLVLQGTLTIKEIAQQMGMSEAGVQNIIKMPLFQDELARRRKAQDQATDSEVAYGVTQAKELLAQTSVAAVETMERVMGTSADPKLQLDAADKILKYAFPKEDRSVKVSAQVLVLDPSKLATLREVLGEIGLTSPKVSEALSPIVDATLVSETLGGVDALNTTQL